MSVELAEWIRLFAEEYLQDFVPSGGSTAKILVCDNEDAPDVIDRVTDCAASAGFVIAKVDSAHTRVHKADTVFIDIASQIDWTAIADKWMRAHLEAAGLFVPEGTELSDTQAIADESRVDVRDAARTINRIIMDKLVRNSKLSSEFRTAIACLCVNRAVPANVTPDNAEIVLQWLTGEKAPLARLKALGIHQRIGRQNARPALLSAARWLHSAGHGGICVIFNLTAVYRDDDCSIRYTRQAVLEMYEMLRQFIDETDRSHYLTAIAVSGPQMLDDAKKDYRIYDAFRLRVVNDIRDRSRDNPLNLLVRVRGGAAGSEETQ